MQHDALRIGLIEDDAIMGESICQRLEIEGHSVDWWKNGIEALAAARHPGKFDIMVCDIRLPDMSGEEVYRRVQEIRDHPPFIFITGFGEIAQAVRLVRMGAADYLTKPFEFEDFLGRLREHARAGAAATGAVLGISPAMRRMEDVLTKYATTDLPVLLTGETGVGKEIAARFVHAVSTPGEPFMAVNCAAIPKDLLESEIFGHEKGAFTGASRQHAGYAERAGAGTLFLDEIGDLDLSMQAKLLRLVEERQFHRIGGETAIRFRGRIVAATHHDLRAEVAARNFRDDLYFRLSVLPAHIPPLRERREDIEWLMAKMLADACGRHDKEVRGFSSLALDMAGEHGWPGNARELRNRIERAVALSTANWIFPGDLFPDIAQTPGARPMALLAEAREDAERRHIERALAQTSGHIGEAARLLGVSRTTLWEKMTRLGLREPADQRDQSRNG